MSLVSGEDSESDEEINTEQVSGQLSSASKLGGPPRLGIIAGEDDEEGDEDESVPEDQKIASESQSGLNIVQAQLPAKKWEPPSVLHKKLGEANLSLRRNIVTRIIQLYQNTCRNLTSVNDSLTRAQGVIEKVNTNVKKSDQDLVLLKSKLDDIFDTASSVGQGLKVSLKQTRPKVGTTSTEIKTGVVP